MNFKENLIHSFSILPIIRKERITQSLFQFNRTFNFKESFFRLHLNLDVGVAI